MSELDKIKEIINTLRGFFAVLMALFVTISSGLINRYDNDKIDFLFYAGLILNFLILFIMWYVINRIFKRTKELEDL